MKWARKLLYIGIVLGIADQLTGINTAMYYTPKILNAAGVPMEDAITLNVVSGGISAIGSAVGLWLVARFARRHVGMYQELGITISLAALSAVFAAFISPYLDGEGNISGAPTFAPWLVLGIVCIFVFIKQSGTVSWVLVSEIYPAAVRGTALGIAVGTLWLANALVAVVFPPLMATVGGAGTYAIFAAINFLLVPLLLEGRPRDEVSLAGGTGTEVPEGLLLRTNNSRPCARWGGCPTGHTCMLNGKERR